MATQTEAVKLAMSWIHANGEHDQLCDIFDLDDNGKHKPCSCGLSRVLTCLREALAEQEQGEPVAHIGKIQFERLKDCGLVTTSLTSHKAFENDIALYTTPQQRTWVGLSEREVELIGYKKIVADQDAMLERKTVFLERQTERIVDLQTHIEKLEVPAKQEGQSNFCAQCEALGRELKAIKQEQGEPVGDGVDEAAFLERFQQNLDRGHKPCQTCEALARTVMLDQSSHDTLQQRTWVGLSDEEKLHIEIMGGKSDVMLAETIEAKLRSKNT